MTQLYYFPNSCAMSVYIALEWAWVDYEAIKAEHGSDDFLKVAPKWAVPALVVDGGETMTQNEALLGYIAHKYPEAGLSFPGDIDRTYQLQNMLAVVSGDLHPAFSPMFASKKYTTQSDEASIQAVKDAAYKNIDRQMNFINTFLDGKDYVVGNKKTIADAYLFTVLRWSFMTPKSALEYPNIKKYFELMNEDEWIIKVLKIHNPE